MPLLLTIVTPQGPAFEGNVDSVVLPGSEGKYVSLKDAIRGFKAIVAGEYDHLPEQAFYMVGGIEEVEEKGKEL